MKKKTQGAPAPNYVKWLWYAALTPFVLLAAMLTLTALGAFGHMPSFEELENPRSNIATEIYSEDGKVLGTFFVQNRSYVQYEELFASDSVTRTSINGREVPPIVAALIATEDARFDSHSGIDIPSLIRVGVKTILLQNRSAGGGSTITQQLAKNLFPRDTVRRQSARCAKAKLVLAKFKEWITALKLEYNYTKGGDRRDVPQHRGVRIERLRHQVGGAHLLQQNARPAQLAGGRRARRRGQRTDALLAGAQLRQRHGPSQPRARAHGRSGAPSRTPSATRSRRCPLRSTTAPSRTTTGRRPTSARCCGR